MTSLAPERGEAAIQLGSLATGPTITRGYGEPTAAEPDGSLYLRKDGGTGTTLYVREAGAWVGK